MTKPRPKASRLPVDFERVAKEYRLGKYSVRELAKRHGIGHQSILRRVAKEGWTQDKAQEVNRRVAERLLLSGPTRADQTTRTTAPDHADHGNGGPHRPHVEATADDVEAAVEERVAVLMEHQRAARDFRLIISTIGRELKETTANLDEIQETIANETEGDTDRSRRARMMRAISLPSRAQSAAVLTGALKNATSIERQAHNLDAEPEKDGSDVTIIELLVFKARVKIPATLEPIFLGEADVRGAFGGRGSAKSRTFAKMTAVRAYMWERAGRTGIILCGRQFMNSLADSSLEEIKLAIRSEPWLNAGFEIGDKFIRTKSGRISYSFMGLDRNIDSVKSKSRILLAWIDEAEPVTEEAYIKLIPTLREEDSELWVTWNPESRRSPTHLRFRMAAPDARTKIAELNWRNNPWFPNILERTRQRDLLNRPESYDHIWEGGFATVFVGAYYAHEMNSAAISGRIGAVAVEPLLPVHTAWDLGIGDSTAIWFFQVVATEIRVVDFYEANGHALAHYAGMLAAKGYTYGDDWLPHDAKVRELGTGKTRVETLVELGRRPRVVPMHTLEDGIQATRLALRLCWFDEGRCESGIDALRQYRTEFDDDAQAFKDKPRHDWTSHAADAFRYLAMAWREPQRPDEDKEKPKLPFKLMQDMTIGEWVDFEDAPRREQRC